MDTTIDSGADTGADDNGLPIDIATLEIDGTRPKVGDRVTFKASGVVRQIVNQTAFVTPEEVNGQPLAPETQASPQDETRAMAQEMDSQMAY